MPQLNPDPWFLIFTLSWLIYLIILTMKVMNFKSPNEPATQNTYMNKPQPWNWPWA